MNPRSKTSLYLTEAHACLALCFILGVATLLHFTIRTRLHRQEVPGRISTLLCAEAQMPAESDQRQVPEDSPTGSGQRTQTALPASGRKPVPRRKQHEYPTAVRPITCSPFDPNSVSGDTLKSWGVRPYVADNIVKYRVSGGSFRSGADLGKIYGMDSVTLSTLSACVVIRESRPGHSDRKLDINAASAADFEKLNGIGPVYAQRILNFREALGGFAVVDQVAETYGLPPETFNHIEKSLEINVKHIKLKINVISAERLAGHPYISHREARSIVNYIAEHGDIRSLEDLSGIYSLDRAWMDRVGPYLDFEPGIESQPRRE